MVGSKKLLVCAFTQRQIDREDHRLTHQTSVGGLTRPSGGLDFHGEKHRNLSVAGHKV